MDKADAPTAAEVQAAFEYHGEGMDYRRVRDRRRGEFERFLARVGSEQPRIVTTVEELDALPVFSVVRVQQGSVLGKLSEGWFVPGVQRPYVLVPILFPAAVLYTPLEADRG